jgi:hypothetical protein
MPKIDEIKFAQQIEAIVDSDYAAIEKLILIKTRLRCDHDTFANAFPSLATYMQAASVKDIRTIREALRRLVEKDGILTREDRPGKSPSYGISKERLQEVIADYVIANREKLRQRRAKPLASNVGGTSDDNGQPLLSNERGTSGDPSHPVGGVSPDPSHFMQRPLPSNGSRPSITYKKNLLTEENSDADASGADAPSKRSASLKSVVWKQGLAYLKTAYDGSIPDKDLRSRLGALIKSHGEGLVLDALTKAEKAEALEPLDYVTGILRKPAGKPRSSGSGVF